ncbi:ATPase inhibitor mai-2, mitochondrial-like [Haemaphysalis longicornis]
MAGDPGSGAGKGGGAGGSIREAGGSFAKMEQAREEQYFRKLQQTQIKLMHDHVMKEIKDREKLIHDLEQQIERNKRILNDLKHINSH